MYLFKKAQDFSDCNKGKVALVKNVKVNDYDGKSLSTSVESSFEFDLLRYDSELIIANNNLKKWYNKNKNTDYFEFTNLSNSDNL